MAKKGSKQSKKSVEESEILDITEDQLEEIIPEKSEESEIKEEIVDENLETKVEKKGRKKKEIEKELSNEDTTKNKFKYFKPYVIEQRDNITRIKFENATHTFMDLLASTLLRTEGVEYSAYKLTSLEPAVLTLITKEGYSYKQVIKSALNTLKTEILDLDKAIKKAF